MYVAPLGGGVSQRVASVHVRAFRYMYISAADPLEFARLSRSVSPDLESALPHTGLGLRFAASFIYPHLLPQMHETGFCATPTRLRELRLAAVQMHAAAGRLQRAWQRATLTRSAVEVTRLLAACVLIQSAARGFLVRLPALIAEDEAWAAEHDEAGPLGLVPATDGRALLLPHRPEHPHDSGE